MQTSLKKLSGLVAALFLIANLLVASLFVFVPSVAASCASNNFTLYVDWFGTGSSQSFCPELTGNPSNLANIGGPCSGTWNDCASSIRVSLDSTHCLATYQHANFSGHMKTYWGPMGPDELDNLLSPNDALSSVKQYAKVPATPAGNC